MRQKRYKRFGLRLLLPVTLVVALPAAGCGDDSSSSDDGEGDSGGTTSGGSGTGGSAGTTSLGGSSGTSGGGRSAGGTSGGAGSGALCNSIPAPTNTVAYAVGLEASPTPAGGALTAGLYYLESVTFYGATSTDCVSIYEERDLRYTVQIVPESASNGRIELLAAVTEIEARLTLDYTIEGVSIVTTATCGDATDDTTPYTAASNALSLFEATSPDCGTPVYILRRN